MKKITNKTLLHQGDKIYKPVEVDGVIFWIDTKPEGFSKGEWMYNEPNNSELIYQFTCDVYPYELGNKIVAQSENKLEGVPVVSSWRLEYCNQSEYSKADILKAIVLTKESAFVDAVDWDKHIVEFDQTAEEILEQINQINKIGVDKHFKIVYYE